MEWHQYKRKITYTSSGRRISFWWSVDLTILFCGRWIFFLFDWGIRNIQSEEM